MKWSKIRSQLRDLWPTAIKDRLDIHTTLYRSESGHTIHMLRCWITLDKEEIFRCSDHEYFDTPPGILDALGDAQPSGVWDGVYSEFCAVRGHYSGVGFQGCLKDYLSMSVSEALSSEIPIFRALALLDKRCGKRTLEKFDLSAEKDDLVKVFYNLRKSKNSVETTA